MEVYIMIEATKGEILGIYDSEEKAKEDIKNLPAFTLVNISKPIKLNTLLDEDKKRKRYCDNCLHKNVCGLEGANDEAMTYCADKLEVMK